MIPLLILSGWLLALPLVVGLCLAAQAGDRHPRSLESVPGAMSPPRPRTAEGGGILAIAHAAGVQAGELESLPPLMYGDDVAA
jgi:hypothetical protein